MINKDRLKETFFMEAREILDNLDALLLELEKDPTNLETLNSVFRSMHTIKGNAGLFGFKQLGHLTHIQEDLLDHLRNAHIAPSPEIMDVLFEGLDATKNIFENLAEGLESHTDNSEIAHVEEKIRRFLPEKSEQKETRRSACRDAGIDAAHALGLTKAERDTVKLGAERSLTAYQVRMRLDPGSIKKGIDPLRLIMRMEHEGAVLGVRAATSSVPPLESLDPAVLYLDDIKLIYLTKLGLDEVDDMFEFAAALGSINVHRLSPLEMKDNFDVEVDQFWLEAKPEQEKLGEILVARGEITRNDLKKALDIQQSSLGEILVQEGLVTEDTVAKALETQKKRSSAQAASVKIPAAKLDSLVDLVGELVITQTLINNDENIKDLHGRGIEKTIGQLTKITKNVQEQVMSIRMMPLAQTFQKMSRVVRDVARKLGKEVEFNVVGEDTEVDKTVIDGIGDPLIHLLRNSVDHGIETVSQRLAAGKPAVGSVTLSAFHRGGNVIIEIRDDGRGLVRETILKKAATRGLITGGEVLTDQQIYALIFEVGFSTAAQITEVSGRGVGLDVVRKNVEALRGRVDVSSEPDKGSVFSIKLPLTLAIIDGMIVSSGQGRYIIPTLNVVSTFKAKFEDFSTIIGRGEVVRVRDEHHPIVRLRDLFNEGKNVTGDEICILVESEGRRSCLLVDNILNHQQVVIKSLGERFKRLQGVSGCAILGDGKVGLILDIGGLIMLSTT